MNEISVVVMKDTPASGNKTNKHSGIKIQWKNGK